MIAWVETRTVLVMKIKVKIVQIGCCEIQKSRRQLKCVLWIKICQYFRPSIFNSLLCVFGPLSGDLPKTCGQKISNSCPLWSEGHMAVCRLHGHIESNLSCSVTFSCKVTLIKCQKGNSVFINYLCTLSVFVFLEHWWKMRNNFAHIIVVIKHKKKTLLLCYSQIRKNDRSETSI